MKNLKKIEQGQDSSTGTSLKGYMYGVSYSKLIEVFGEPTYPNESGDGKVQFEWVFDYKGEPFTLYDWKTYDREYTMNELTKWNVGALKDASDFIDKLQTLINK